MLPCILVVRLLTVASNGADIIRVDHAAGNPSVMGYAWGLFSSAFLSATLLPGSSELVLAALVWQQPRWSIAWWAVATFGNVLGSMTSWWLGALCSRRKQAPKALQSGLRALAWLTRYGYWSLLLAWVPVVGDPLCVLSGWLRWSFWRCLLLILIGKAARYALIVGAGGALVSG